MVDPPNCKIGKSFVAPKVAAPILAIVGGKNYSDLNPVMQKTVKYLETMRSADMSSFNLQLKYYETEQDLFDYIASPTYLSPDPGVCFGFAADLISIYDYDDWEIRLFFLD